MTLELQPAGMNVLPGLALAEKTTLICLMTGLDHPTTANHLERNRLFRSTRT